MGPAWTRLFLQVQVDNQKEAEQVQQQFDIAAVHHKHSDLSVDVWGRTQKLTSSPQKLYFFRPEENLSKIR